MIKIVKNRIDTESVLASVHSDTCGAAVLFVGTTRRLTGGRETTKLEYECYDEMAIAKINQLCDQARRTWTMDNISVVHRVGTVEIGESSIAIAVSSPHRKSAFEAAQWLIDELKQQVPIWKKEHWADGSTEWVHPDGSVPRTINTNNGADG